MVVLLISDLSKLDAMSVSANPNRALCASCEVIRQGKKPEGNVQARRLFCPSWLPARISSRSQGMKTENGRGKNSQKGKAPSGTI